MDEAESHPTTVGLGQGTCGDRHPTTHPGHAGQQLASNPGDYADCVAASGDTQKRLVAGASWSQRCLRAPCPHLSPARRAPEPRRGAGPRGPARCLALQEGDAIKRPVGQRSSGGCGGVGDAGGPSHPFPDREGAKATETRRRSRAHCTARPTALGQWP